MRLPRIQLLRIRASTNSQPCHPGLPFSRPHPSRSLSASSAAESADRRRTSHFLVARRRKTSGQAENTYSSARPDASLAPRLAECASYGRNEGRTFSAREMHSLAQVLRGKVNKAARRKYRRQRGADRFSPRPFQG